MAMADKEFWIQLENRPWDACPNNFDRMHGADIAHVLEEAGAPPIPVALTSPETGVTTNRTMFLPVNRPTQTGAGGAKEWRVIDALILRRYTEGWQAPDDRKVNPWDLNEPDPTDNGTMGTIPGPTLECNVGDRIIVHFRNKDFRPHKHITACTHSLHPHGIAFAPYFDGAFPLTPPDPKQPIPPPEAAAWAAIKVTGGCKQGDRVPPGGTFTYTWDTFGWPTTAGVWHYHDHSICDHVNVGLGALGFLVIHNPDDPDDVLEQDLPQGQPNGKLTRFVRQASFDPGVPLLPHQLEGLRRVMPEEGGARLIEATRDAEATSALLRQRAHEEENEQAERGEAEHGITSDFALKSGPFVLEVDRDLRTISGASMEHYIDPPRRLQILQYYHELPGVYMAINGRRFLGNTPTVIAGTETKMRFGVAGMNSDATHTFHLHGHRWVIPGPQGTDLQAIQSSPQVQAVSQFEDSRLLGPANSFNFTINQGSFMGSRFTPDPSRAPGTGEWHMHCHVLEHMMGGMMGSLLVIEGGELVLPLAKGTHCHAMEDTIVIKDFAFDPPNITVAQGTEVLWVNNDQTAHTATADDGAFDKTLQPGESYTFKFNQPGTHAYHCKIHPEMTGTVTVSGAAPSTIVTMKNFRFDPPNITVAQGTEVLWVNNDQVARHTVTADDGAFDSGDVPPSGSFSFTYNVQPGTYAYHCIHHAPTMTGTVNVQ
jgi:plastocyanin